MLSTVLPAASSLCLAQMPSQMLQTRQELRQRMRATGRAAARHRLPSPWEMLWAAARGPSRGMAMRLETALQGKKSRQTLRNGGRSRSSRSTPMRPSSSISVCPHSASLKRRLSDARLGHTCLGHRCTSAFGHSGTHIPSQSCAHNILRI